MLQPKFFLLVVCLLLVGCVTTDVTSVRSFEPDHVVSLPQTPKAVAACVLTSIEKNFKRTYGHSTTPNLRMYPNRDDVELIYSVLADVLYIVNLYPAPSGTRAEIRTSDGDFAKVEYANQLRDIIVEHCGG